MAGKQLELVHRQDGIADLAGNPRRPGVVTGSGPAPSASSTVRNSVSVPDPARMTSASSLGAWARQARAASRSYRPVDNTISARG